MARLTDKQRIFIEHYLVSWNATKAAEAAGYKDPEQAGYENKKKQEIQAVIQSRLAEKTMGADEVLARLTDHARGSLAPFLRFERGLKPGIDFNQASAQANLHLIKKYTIGKDGSISIELHDAQRALELLAKHYGLFASDGADWREEAARAGLNAAEIFNNLVSAFAAALQARTGSTDPRRLGGSAEAGTIIDAEPGA